MSLEEHQQTDPEELGLEAAGAPDTGDDLPTNDTPEDGETPEDENNSTPEDAQDSSESGEVQETEETRETGETEKSGETEEKETNESNTVDVGELKIVLHLRDGRTSAGVWQPGADVHLETFMETDMSILLAELPGLLERARARWNENPLRPKYEPPKKTKKAATNKTPTKKTPTKKTPTKNQQNKKTPATETQQELELQVEPEPQQGMARLF